MEKILFMNFSPNKRGNTYQIGEKLLENNAHDVIQMVDYKVCQYGQESEDDQMKAVFEKVKEANTLVIGTPVYWYTVGGMLKTFIDRLYSFSDAKTLEGKKLYLFAQGEAPNDATKESITFLAKRLCVLMKMELKGVIVDTYDGKSIIDNMKID